MNKLQNTFRAETKYQSFFLSMAFFDMAYGLYKGVINNYLAEIVTMTEFDKVVSEFFRELPGLTFIFILAAFYTLSAEKIYKIGSVIMLLGMCIYTQPSLLHAFLLPCPFWCIPLVSIGSVLHIPQVTILIHKCSHFFPFHVDSSSLYTCKSFGRDTLRAF